MTSSLHSLLGGFAQGTSSEAPLVAPSGTPAMSSGHAISGLDALRGGFGELPTSGVPGGASGGSTSMNRVVLSDEQRAVIDAALAGRDVIVEATIGTGKTTMIQELCNELNSANPGLKILYLTYSRLLKDDARARVTGAKVQNYHGVVYPGLLAAGIKCGVGESIAMFNRYFDAKISANFEIYDVIVVDEYQDITEEYARLLENIKSKNPVMQTIMVGDMEQKVSAASNHDAQAFARRFCDDPEILPFTKSFRMGPEMAAKLAQAWNKPITGVNTSQSVELMDFDEAVAEMLAMSNRQGDILCLGKRNGQMTDALNMIERKAPWVFNKNTVFASVRDKGGQVSFTPSSAIFTTFDSSKGLERDTCFIFDYTYQTFRGRLSFDGVNPEVLRNVFLVAASRGKSRIIFVSVGKSRITHLAPDAIGGIPIEKFLDLPKVTRPQYDVETPFNTSEMFDFKYVETVDAAYDLLDITRTKEADEEPLEIRTSDGLIDLMSVVDQYQKNVFFDAYDNASALAAYGDFEKTLLARNTKVISNHAKATARITTAWDDALALVATITNYDRYMNQVQVSVSTSDTEKLKTRLSELLDPSDEIQRRVEITGTAFWTRSESSPVAFAGVCDVVQDDAVVQLHYTAELDHAMFLEAAMLAVLARKDKAVLWNTRTDERWEVRVPDEQRFLDAVMFCVSKQAYKSFKKD